MEILGQTPIQSILFFTLYGITGVVPLIAAFYLLLRRANAIAPGVTPPVRLRRWTAAFFAVATLAHVWWLLFNIFCRDVHSFCYLVLAMLDCVLLFTAFAGMLLAMLQDRHRPMWPALAAVIPFVLLAGAYMVYPIKQLEQIAAAYLLLVGLAFTGYMVFAIRQYGRWLNDNYADLENKRVWLSQVVSLVSMLLFVLYVLATDIVFIWLIHIVELVLVGLLLWRVETLPSLSLTPDPSPIGEGSDSWTSQARSESTQGGIMADELSTPLANRRGAGGEAIDLEHIEQLLKEHCVAPQLYLQHDLTLQQLAQAIGTNRTYLSQYFSHQGINYNTYINSLRVNHFISLYHKAVAAGQPFKLQQLAIESGYHSYSTFSRAFTKLMDQSVTYWTQGKGK